MNAKEEEENSIGITCPSPYRTSSECPRTTEREKFNCTEFMRVHTHGITPTQLTHKSRHT